MAAHVPLHEAVRKRREDGAGNFASRRAVLRATCRGLFTSVKGGQKSFSLFAPPLRIFPTSSTFASDLADQPRGRLARAQSLHCVGFTPTRTGVAASLVQCIKLNQAEGERETAAARSLPVETRRITRHARLTHSNPPSPHSRSLALALSPRKLFVKRRHPSEATGDALAGGWVGAAAQHSQQKGASLLSSPRPPQRACVNRH